MDHRYSQRPGVPSSSLTMLRRLVDGLALPAATVDRAGAVGRANTAWTSMLGTATYTLRQAVLGDDHARLAEALAMLRPDGGSAPLAARTAGGRWAHWQLQPLTGDDLYLCVCIDVHDLVPSEQATVDRRGLQGSLLQGSPDCVKVIDPAGRLVFMNDAGCAALGVDPATGFGQVWLDLLPPDVRALGESALAKAGGGVPARFLGRSERADGRVEVWDNLLTPAPSDDSASAIICVSRNVSEEQATTQALRQAEQRLAMATTVGDLGVWDLDVVSGRLFCDRTWHEIMGREPADPVTTVDDFRPMIHPDDVERATEIADTAADLIARDEDYTIGFRVVRPDGEERWVRSVASIVKDENGSPVRAVGFVEDITVQLRERATTERAIRVLREGRAALVRQSLEDPLTTLPNRRALTDVLRRIASPERRIGSPFCVAMIDIDHFKEYNDLYGHVAGDRVLVSFADCLRQIAGPEDLVARYGGEEFVLVLAQTDTPEPALRRLFDLLAGLQLPHPYSPFGRITISCGCAVFDPPGLVGRQPETIVMAADRVMYKAKGLGRGCFVVERA